MSAEYQPDVLRLGLLNIMPTASLKRTEEAWKGVFRSHAEIVPLRFDGDPRMLGSASSYLSDKPEFSAVCDSLDGLVITGANLERSPDYSQPLAFNALNYASQLRKVIDWAEKETRLAVYSCLASHLALEHMYGIERRLMRQKLFGVYCHDILTPDPLTEGCEYVVRAPHSRWGEVSSRQFDGTDVDVLIEGFEVDWLLARRKRNKGISIFLQGHPEYGQFDLQLEYERDRNAGQMVPHKYYPNDDPGLFPSSSWACDSLQLFKNIGQYAQSMEVLYV